MSVQSIFNHSGGNGEGVPPVLIPNTEVKPFSADGTWLDTAWESRSPPVTTKARRHIAARLSFFSQHSRLVTYASMRLSRSVLKKQKSHHSLTAILSNKSTLFFICRLRIAARFCEFRERPSPSRTI